VEVEYPVGHRRRRAEGLPLLWEKGRAGLGTRLEQDRIESIVALFQNAAVLDAMPIDELVGRLTVRD
jgi:2-methylcitrate dehydratase